MTDLAAPLNERVERPPIDRPLTAGQADRAVAAAASDRITWRDATESLLLHLLVVILLLTAAVSFPPRPPPIAAAPAIEVALTAPSPAAPPPAAEKPPPPAPKPEPEPKPPPESKPEDSIDVSRASEASSNTGGDPAPAARTAAAAAEAANGHTAPAAPTPTRPQIKTLAPQKTATVLDQLTPHRPRLDIDAAARLRQMSRRAQVARREASPEPTEAPATQTRPVALADAAAPKPAHGRSDGPIMLSNGAEIGLDLNGSAKPGGDDAAIYDAYLAEMIERIDAHQDLLQLYSASDTQGDVKVGFVIDRQGRLQNYLPSSAASIPLNNSLNILLSVTSFGAPPSVLFSRQDDKTLTLIFTYRPPVRQG